MALREPGGWRRRRSAPILLLTRRCSSLFERSLDGKAVSLVKKVAQGRRHLRRSGDSSKNDVVALTAGLHRDPTKLEVTAIDNDDGLIGAIATPSGHDMNGEAISPELGKPLGGNGRSSSAEDLMDHRGPLAPGLDQPCSVISDEVLGRRVLERTSERRVFDVVPPDGFGVDVDDPGFLGRCPEHLARDDLPEPQRCRGRGSGRHAREQLVGAGSLDRGAAVPASGAQHPDQDMKSQAHLFLLDREPLGRVVSTS